MNCPNSPPNTSEDSCSEAAAVADIILSHCAAKEPVEDALAAEAESKEEDPAAAPPSLLISSSRRRASSSLLGRGRGTDAEDRK